MWSAKIFTNCLKQGKEITEERQDLEGESVVLCWDGSKREFRLDRPRSPQVVKASSELTSWMITGSRPAEVEFSRIGPWAGVPSH